MFVAPDKDLKPYNTFSSAIESYRHIGNYEDKANNKVALFTVCLKNDKNLENARSMQRAFIKSLLENSNCQGALVAFYTLGEQDKWRLSLVRMDYEFSKGKLSEKLTPAKRYSYLVGKGEPCHTAQERLYPIFLSDDHNPSLDELEDAFSVEAVTKDFFDKYREKYLDLKDYLDNNAEFITESESRGFDSEQFAKKLMGQIVFLYFIQKKGWLGVNAFPAKLSERGYKDGFYRTGNKPKTLMPAAYKRAQDGYYYRDNNAIRALSPEDETYLSTLVKGDAWGSGPKDFMRQIFIGCTQVNKNFFDDYLEPLFYTGLNKNRGDGAFFPPLHRRIPFLNGGLFEEMEGYDWRNNNFSIPNEYFSNLETKGRNADGILDIFDRYNFTMAEDEPMEREVAIDPEMLGKVFENLLDVKDRKSKGAFYTPREIVHYMCQESLINYLASKTGISDSDIRKFILYGEYFRDEDTKKTLAIDNESGKVLQGDEIYNHKHHMEYDKARKLEIPASIFSYKDNVNRLHEIDDLLANVKIVDPAVGSGAFPLGMLNEIVKARDTITNYMVIDMNGFQRLSFRSSRSPYILKRDTIKNCIFACDIEASATDITKLRLWLSLVIDNQIMDQENIELGYTTKPRELPNLDCNIICGNSLMDRFHGIELITESDALNNISFNRQSNIYDQQLALKINELIELQSKLYDEKDHVAKESIKNQIQDIYNKIILKQLEGSADAVNAYYETINHVSKPFVLWQLYYPKVFRDNGGFDIVIGNPPYFLYQASHKDEIDELRKIEDLQSAFGGKLNAYKLFLAKALHSLAKDGGVVCYIFQNSFLADKQATELRKDVFKNFQILKIDSYPERDSVKKRVFEAVKMSVCIALFVKSCTDRPFVLNVWNDKHKTSGIQTIFTKKDIALIDPDTLSIPRIRQEYLPLVVKINENPSSFHMKCYEGELNMTVHRPFFTKDTTQPKVLKGASIQRYFWTENMSQGEIEYVDEISYQKKFQKSAKANHHKQERIVMQGMTGANDKIRIIATVIPAGIYLANSCNYILADGHNINYMLGVFNSKLINWYFRCFSTNSNVNGYEIDNLPIPLAEKQIEDKIIQLVETILRLKSEDHYADTKTFEKEIDNLVYSLYNLTSKEIQLIENS